MKLFPALALSAALLVPDAARAADPVPPPDEASRFRIEDKHLVCGFGPCPRYCEQDTATGASGRFSNLDTSSLSKAEQRRIEEALAKSDRIIAVGTLRRGSENSLRQPVTLAVTKLLSVERQNPAARGDAVIAALTCQ